MRYLLPLVLVMGTDAPVDAPIPALELKRVILVNGGEGVPVKEVPRAHRFLAEAVPIKDVTFSSRGDTLRIHAPYQFGAPHELAEVKFVSDCPVNSEFDFTGEAQLVQNQRVLGGVKEALIAWTKERHGPYPLEGAYDHPLPGGSVHFNIVLNKRQLSAR